MKLHLLLVLAISWLSDVATYFETYIYEDWGYMKFLLVMVIADTLLGLYKAFKLKKLSSRGWGRVLDKIVSYISILIMIHVLSSFTVNDKVITAFDWIKAVAYSMIMVKEGISILENVGAINSRLVPTWILKKLKEFDEEGKFVFGSSSDKTKSKDK